MKLGSLFDGSGGFPLGGMLAGIEPVWASEIEPFPIRVTTKRIPSMKHYGDVSEINGADVEPVDIITFGSPCQDMSVAGKRAGLDGARSGLFYQATRIIREMRDATNGRYPRWAVWENVPGAFSSNNGDDFKAVLEELISVARSERGTVAAVTIPKPDRWDTAGCVMGKGYSVAWRVLDAQYWGVPQRRKRIFVVADFTGERAGDVLFKSEGVSRYSAESFRAWQRASRSAQTGVGNAVTYCIDQDGGKSQCGVTADLSPTLATTHGGEPVVTTISKTTRPHSADEAPTYCESNTANTLNVNDIGETRCNEYVVYENHGQDARYKQLERSCETISAKYGEGGTTCRL